MCIFTQTQTHTPTPTEAPAHIHMLYELTEKWSKRKFQGYEDMNVHWAKLKKQAEKKSCTDRENNTKWKLFCRYTTETEQFHSDKSKLNEIFNPIVPIFAFL